MTSSVHPADALTEPGSSLPVLPVCDHYAGSERFISRAVELLQEMGPVFDLTCDCEDGAPAGQEIGHARMIADLIKSSPAVKGRIGVRIHGYRSPFWRSDAEILLAACARQIAYVAIPKSHTCREVREMAEFIQAGARAGGRISPMPLHILIETQHALHEVWEIAGTSNVEVLDFGLLDFISEHQGAIPESCMRSPGQFENRLLSRAKSEIAAAALAHGVVPSHNITLELNNPEQVYQDALRARLEFGFLRMWSIHPSQIEPVTRAFRPDFSLLDRACAVLLAGQRAAWAPVNHNGELHDRASYRHYWALVRQARLYSIPLPKEIESKFFREEL